MKCAVAVLTLVLASQCLANPVGDVYRDIIVDLLKFIKKELTIYDPLPLPDFQNLSIQDENVNLAISQTNTQLSKASTFEVEEVTTDPKTLTATVRVKIPKFVLTADYVVSGTAYNKKVSGKGNLSVTLDNLDQTITATVVNPDTNVQISSLVLKYDLDSVKVKETGLIIEGMTAAQTAAYIEKTFTDMILNQKDRVAAITAAVLKVKLNDFIRGGTLLELFAVIKHLIDQ